MKLKNLFKRINVFAENRRLRDEIRQLNHILDSEHRRAIYNEQFLPNI